MKRWLLKNPLLAGLSGLCCLLAAALLFMLLQGRGRESKDTRGSREGAVRGGTRAGEKSCASSHHEYGEQGSLKRLEKSEKERSANREKEFKVELREVEKAASEARRQRDEQLQQRKLAEELAQTADQLRQDALEPVAPKLRGNSSRCTFPRARG